MRQDSHFAGILNLTSNQKVAGSSPAGSTNLTSFNSFNLRALTASDRAICFGPRCDYGVTAEPDRRSV